MGDCDQSCHFHCSYCWYMTPAILWVTWTQPQVMMTAAISNYQSQLMQSACFTLHNEPVIGSLHLSVTETIYLSPKQMCDCGCGQRTDYLSFWLVAVFVVVNQPQPDSVSYSTIAAWRISWGSGQKFFLIHLFAPAAHSWRVFASEFLISEDCVSGRWEVGRANLPDLHIFIWICQIVSVSFCFSRSSWMSSCLHLKEMLCRRCSSVCWGVTNTLPHCSGSSRVRNYSGFRLGISIPTQMYGCSVVVSC